MRDSSFVHRLRAEIQETGEGGEDKALRIVVLKPVVKQFAGERT